LPRDQAAFWLSECRRITAAHPEDAELAIGAALVLAEPDPSFMLWVIGPRGGFSPPGFFGRVLDEFHVLADPRVVQLAARATELDGNETDWWRIRAILHFGPALNKPPRAPEWMEVLRAAASVDKGNGLYDYLLAAHLWNMERREQRDEDEPIRPSEGDSEAFKAFRRAQMQPFVSSDTRGRAAALAFLEKARVYPEDIQRQLSQLQGRCGQDVLVLLPLQIGRRYCRAIEKEDWADAQELLAGLIQFYHQVRKDPANEEAAQWIGRHMMPWLDMALEAAENRPESWDVEAVEEFQHVRDRLSRTVEIEEDQGLADGDAHPRYDDAEGYSLSILQVISVRALATSCLLALVGAIGTFVVRGHAQASSAAPGRWFIDAALFASAMATSFFWLGLVPAGLVSARTESILLQATALGIIGAILPFAASPVWRRIQPQRASGGGRGRRWPWAIVLGLAASMLPIAVAMVTGAAGIAPMDRIPHIPELSLAPLPPSVLRATSNAESTTSWGAIQWYLYWGGSAGVAMAMTVSTVLGAYAQATNPVAIAGQARRLRTVASAGVRRGTRCALLSAYLCLNLYLVLTIQVVNQAEADYQRDTSVVGVQCAETEHRDLADPASNLQTVEWPAVAGADYPGVAPPARIVDTLAPPRSQSGGFRDGCGPRRLTWLLPPGSLVEVGTAWNRLERTYLREEMPR
jgi:hypothetical protein